MLIEGNHRTESTDNRDTIALNALSISFYYKPPISETLMEGEPEKL